MQDFLLRDSFACRIPTELSDLTLYSFLFCFVFVFVFLSFVVMVVSLFNYPHKSFSNWFPKCFTIILILVTAPRIACDNPFRVVLLSLLFENWTNLIKNNVFYNHTFIFYKKHHKCNI